jgi:hypothetical protein
MILKLITNQEKCKTNPRVPTRAAETILGPGRTTLMRIANELLFIDVQGHFGCLKLNAVPFLHSPPGWSGRTSHALGVSHGKNGTQGLHG